MLDVIKNEISFGNIIGILSLLFSFFAYKNTRNIKKVILKRNIYDKIITTKKMMKESQSYLQSIDMGNLYQNIMDITQALASLLESSKDNGNIIDAETSIRIEKVRKHLLKMSDKPSECSFNQIIDDYQKILAFLESKEEDYNASLN